MVACYLYIFFLFSSLVIDVIESRQSTRPDKFNVHFIEGNSTYNFKPTKRGFFKKHLNTYCYIGEPKTLGRLLETVELQLDIEGDDYTQYEGPTPQDVEEHYKERRSLFSFNLYSKQRNRLALSPFVQHCIGIDTVVPYSIRLVQEKIDYIRLSMLLSGLFIFIFANKLSANAIFYYIIGIALGICSSFLLLIWLFGKLMPKKTMMSSVIIGGWTIGFYVMRMLWRNVQMIMITYRGYVCWYIIITGLISFFFCYRWGPPQNRRTKNIIMWLLQLISLALIYLSSNFKEAIVTIIAMTVVIYYLLLVLNRGMRTKNAMSINVCDISQNVGIPRSIRKGCKQLGLNSSQYKKSRKNIFPSRMRLYKTCAIRNSQKTLHKITNDYTHLTLSECDLSCIDNSTPKKALYQLPGGSFLLSEKHPTILDPKREGIVHSPMYDGSTPLLVNDALCTNEDYTPRRHLQLPFSSSNIRRCTAALFGSELAINNSHRRHRLRTEFQRSSSVQRNQSRSPIQITSAKKNFHKSFPKIRPWTPDSLMLRRNGSP